MEAIIFDVDGTLWDSTEAVAKSWNLAIEENTDLDMRVNAEQLKGLFGKPLDDIADILFPMLVEADRRILQRHLYEYEHDMIEKEECYFYEGVKSVIPALSEKYKLFIVSNCQSGYIEAFLKVSGLGAYITDFTCPGETNLLKGDNLKLIMQRNHLNSAIYVGDTQGDAEACKIAGIPIIYASYGFGSVQSPDYVIAGFSDLLILDF
ncbi:HAD family hydrolase [Konateibacter massiliensis]|uniref:HAD family hydrolase n=1 Tax=Konateibacter massiliensis TaxID=2002841 RepID=UPI000C154B88|nr:HAD family hydrolase [Konateibacter massiliensis]